jgi:carbamoyl-phosphate synthase small subunit
VRVAHSGFAIVRPGLLVTADGTEFRGRAAGSGGTVTGEVVFNTAMTGYQEVVTDPSYAGQIVTMTAPHIGNYGVNRADDQAERIHCPGLVVRSLSRTASGARTSGGFDEYLAAAGVVVLSEVDTRRLTRHIRARGAMPAAMGSDVDSADLRALAESAPEMTGRDLMSAVTTAAPYLVPAIGTPKANVVAYDLGIKRGIVDQLTRRGCSVYVVPGGTSAAEALGLGPDGVFLSNGPGDPEPLAGPVAAVRALLGRVPMFGVCLGHQVMGLALGAETFKLPFGHHGTNHPVRRLADGVVHITSQNHGFAVDLSSLAGVGPGRMPEIVATDFGPVTATHVNLNDGTLEGMSCRELPAFSVQFHPEAYPGPHDASGLFDQFMVLMGVAGEGAVGAKA